MLVLLLILACGGGSEHPVEDTSALASAAAVLAEVRANPAVAPERCPRLSDAALRDQCEDIGRRPHLGDGLARPAPGAAGRSEPRVGDVGRSRAWLVAHGEALEWPVAAPPSCGETVDPVRCVEQAATARVVSGDDAGALALCAALPGEAPRGDCAFRVAESLVMAPDRPAPPAVARAARLCRWAVPYDADCLRHLAGDVARLAPVDASGGWSALLERGAAVEEALGGELGRALADEVLALGAWLHVDSRREACVEAGAPAALAVHLRSALAWRTVQGPGSLEAAAAALVDAAHTRFCPSRPLPHRDYDVAGLWDRLLPAEVDLPQVAFLATATRLAAPDQPEVDAAIAILEAEARRPRPPLELLGQGLDHEDWRVRWTAVRLLSALGAPVERTTDPHPLVRGRLAAG